MPHEIPTSLASPPCARLVSSPRLSGFCAPQMTTHLRNTQVGFTSALLTLISVQFILVWAAHSDRRGGAAAARCSGRSCLSYRLLWDGIHAESGLGNRGAGSSLDRESICRMGRSGHYRDSLLSGPAASGGIALISSVAFLGGFIRPNVFGPTSDASHGYTVGLSILAALALTAHRGLQ
jgi:hypothetical protein